MGINYLLIHLALTIPVLALLFYFQPQITRTRKHLKSAGFLFMITLSYLYTIPWDNLMIEYGAWSYSDSAVLVAIWNAPLGEYMFFGIQTLIAGLWLYKVDFDSRPVNGDMDVKTRISGVIVLSSMFVLSALLLAQGDALYAVSIVLWATPVFILQWSVGGAFLTKRWKLLLKSIIPPSIYLCAVDYVAIYFGFWTISEDFTIGVEFGVIPFEEVLFFVTATTMVVFGLVLFEWSARKWDFGLHACRIGNRINDVKRSLINKTRSSSN